MNVDALQLWGLAAVLIILVLAIMLWPLIKRRGGNPAPREAYDITVYKDQLLEIEADLERGLLSADQGEAARTEIKRRMLSAAGDSDAATEPVGSQSNGVVITLITILVPLGAVLMYLGLGQPGQPDQPLAERKANTTQAQTEQDQDIEKAIAKLARNLEAQPDDLRGWRLLGRTYLSQGRYGEAASAMAEAYRLSGDDPDIVVNYAEARTLADDSQIDEKTRGLFEMALGLDSFSPKARYYLGLYEAQQGNLRKAMQSWIDLAVLSPPDAPWLQVVDQQVGSAAEQSGIDPSSIEPSAEALALAAKIGEAMSKTQAAESGPGPTTDDVKAAMGMSTGDRNEMIRSMVERLASRMKENPGDKEGWIRLERAYRVLGEIDKADAAAAQAAKLP